MKFQRTHCDRNGDQQKLIQKRNHLLTELQQILTDSHVKSVLSAHEQLMEEIALGAQRNQYYEMYESDTSVGKTRADPSENRSRILQNDGSGGGVDGVGIGGGGAAVRVVGIRKSEDEPLGITVREEDDGRVVVARVMTGGIVDVQGLLHANDEVLEVNGQRVKNAPQLQELIRRCTDSIIHFKIVPSFVEPAVQLSCHMRALFNYDPQHDSLLPCKELGLPFVQGDILEILNQEDANWWQARKVDSLNTSGMQAAAVMNVLMSGIGLVPSQELEEKRRAFVRPEFDYASKTSICGTRVIKKKKKALYSLNSNTTFDTAELIFYEEMCRLNHFQRKSVALIGASGVGRRTMKQRLIQSQPDKFAGVTPSTSRPPREGEVNGRVYFFVNRELMEQEIADNQYLEFGEFQGHLYGTRLESIREVIDQGKIAVIDCNPQSLKLLRSPEFMPFIVFLGAPPIDQLRYIHDWGRQNNVSRNLTLDRAVGRSSRRAKTLQSLASFYEDEDLQNTIEESNRIQRIYERYFDLTLVNFNFEQTFQRLREAIHSLENEPQWVPISWVLHEE